MPEQKRRPVGSGAVLLGGEQPVSTEIITSPQPNSGHGGGDHLSGCEGKWVPANAPEQVQPNARHAHIRSRLAAAADYGNEACSRALSPCSRDLGWWICRLSDQFAHDAHAPLAQIERALLRAEHLWRACMEIEFLETCQWPVEVGL